MSSRPSSRKHTLVHQCLLGGLRMQQWETALKEIYGVLKPGGWAQLLDLEGWAADPTFAKFLYAINKISEDVGLLIHNITLRLPDFLEQSGFVNTHEVVRSILLSPSRGQGGVDGKIGVMSVLHGYKKVILEEVDMV